MFPKINNRNEILILTMTNTQKRSLYESIMKDVAKIVKRQLNEQDALSSDENYATAMEIKTSDPLEFCKNPKYNSLWSKKYPEEIHLDSDGDIEIVGYFYNLDDDDDLDELKISGKTLASVLEKYDIINSAVISIYSKSHLINPIALIKLPKKLKKLWKNYFKLIDDAYFKQLDEKCDEFELYLKKKNVKNITQLKFEIEKWLERN